MSALVIPEAYRPLPHCLRSRHLPFAFSYRTPLQTGGCNWIDPRLSWRVKSFYTGPVVNAELLVTMLEKHGIAATQEFVDPTQPDEGDLNRSARVFVSEADYERAYRLFHAGREDEL